MTKYTALAILFVVAFLSPLRSLGKTADMTELSLEELMNVTVTGASRFEQKVNQAPAYVNVVTADDIRKYGYKTLAHILRSLPGFYAPYDRTYDYVGVRGFSLPGDYNSRFLVLIDGHRANENIYDSSGIGTDGIVDVDLIEKVEVIQGPGSSLYGSNAFFGVINIVTKKGDELNGAQIASSASSFDTYKGRVTYGNKFSNGLEILLSATGHDSKGPTLDFKEYNDPATNFGETRDTDYDRGRSAFANLSYRDFTFTGAYNRRTKGLPTAPFGSDFNSRKNSYFDEQAYLDAGYNHTFSNEATVQAHVSYDYYYFQGKYPYLEGINAEAPSLNRDSTKGTWWTGNLLFMKTILDKHKVSIGGEYVRNSQQDQKNYSVNLGAMDSEETVDPVTVNLREKRDSSRWAIFVQDEFSILKNLVFNAGLRYDSYSVSGTTLNPRMALIYHPFEKTTVKFLYGSAFRAPNPYELYYGDQISMKANPALDPEIIKTYELVCEQFFLGNFRVAGAVFYNSIDDLILQEIDDDGLSVFRNIGKVDTKGVEIELEGTWKNGFRGRLSYTYQDAKDKDTDTRLVNSPKHMAKLNLIAPLWQDKFFSGLEVQYMSSRKTLNSERTGGFFLTNLTLLSEKVVKGLDVSLSIYNLFDKKYSYPASNDHYPINTIEQDGRTFRLKFTYAF